MLQRRRFFLRFHFGIPLWLALAVACSSGTAELAAGQVDWIPAPATDLGEVVATVEGVPIYSSQVAGMAAEKAISPKAALAYWIQFHILSERARTAGVDAARIAREAGSHALDAVRVQRFLECEFEPSASIEKMPTELLREQYTKMIDTFVHPRLVQVDMLSVVTGPRLKPEGLARRKQAALELWRYLQSRPDRETLDVAALGAEPRWREKNIGHRRIWQGTDKPYSAVFGTEVQKLGRKGQMTGIVDDGLRSGFHIAWYRDERLPKNVTFMQAEPELRSHYHPEWRQMQFVDFTRNLAAGREIRMGAMQVGSAN